jgi:hypothetical protein
MFQIQDLLTAAALPALKAVGKLEMENVLSNIKDHCTPEIYKNTLQGLYSDFSLLRDASLKTNSKIDDGIVALVLEAVKEKADASGIVLN